MTDSGDQPKVNGVAVRRAKQVQHFSPNLIDIGTEEGWLTYSGGYITIRSVNAGELKYRVACVPGYYCCHCGKSLDGEVAARQHVKAEHDGQKSPDLTNPSGYRRDHHYTCILEGPEINNLSKEEAAKMADGIRQTLIKGLGEKYRRVVKHGYLSM